MKKDKKTWPRISIVLANEADENLKPVHYPSVILRPRVISPNNSPFCLAPIRYCRNFSFSRYFRPFPTLFDLGGFFLSVFSFLFFILLIYQKPSLAIAFWPNARVRERRRNDFIAIERAIPHLELEGVELIDQTPSFSPSRPLCTIAVRRETSTPLRIPRAAAVRLEIVFPAIHWRSTTGQIDYPPRHPLDIYRPAGHSHLLDG